jgi:AraC-like DNA-binding protein
MHEGLPVYGINDFRPEKETAEFYISRFSEHMRKHDFITRPHRHDFYIILYFSAGSGEHVIDFVKYEVKPGQIFFLGPGQVHSWSLSRDVEGDILFFSREFFESYFNNKKLSSFSLFKSGAQLISASEHMEILWTLDSTLRQLYHEYASSSPASKNIIRDYLDILLHRLSHYIPSTPEAETVDTGNWQIQQLRQLIDENFLRHYTPADYAQELHLNVKYLNELCQKYLGKTTSRLIQERMLLEAKRLLAHNDLSISQVSAQLNFEDNSYFSRFFKKISGQSPEQWRKTIQGL